MSSRGTARKSRRNPRKRRYQEPEVVICLDGYLGWAVEGQMSEQKGEMVPVIRDQKALDMSTDLSDLLGEDVPLLARAKGGQWLLPDWVVQRLMLEADRMKTIRLCLGVIPQDRGGG